MAQLVNPRIEAKIYGDETITIKDLFMRVSITKDLEDEPNEAELTIYNLSSATRGKLVADANSDAPIDILLTPHGVDELVVAFRGEIDGVSNRNTRPGYETTIRCQSQQRNHRQLHVDKKTFSKGTSISSIVDFFADTIALPTRIETVPAKTITLSQSFDGPAFPLLKRFVQDFGFYCYILDGVLVVSSVAAPENPTAISVNPDLLLEAPEPTTTRDADKIDRLLVLDVDFVDPSLKKKRRKKKTVKGIAAKNSADVQPDDVVEFTETDAVDAVTHGYNFTILLQPDIQPDNLVHFDMPELKNKLHRVLVVEHNGNNESFEEWTTTLQCELYDDDEGTILAGLGVFD